VDFSGYSGFLQQQNIVEGGVKCFFFNVLYPNVVLFSFMTRHWI